MLSEKAVVTGGTGFIGSHLSEELLRRGYHVTILDNFSTGRMSNIEWSSNTENLELVRGNILDQPLLKRVFDRATYVFHLAALPSVLRSVTDPLASHEANATGTLGILIAARDCLVRKVIYSSSSSVYGNTPTLPKREDVVPSPLSPYAVSKLAGEHYCHAFQETYGFPTVCLRYFNVYGPRQNPSSQYAAVIPLFIRSIKRGVSPTIFGDGGQTRDFTFVKDVVEANILAAESDATGVFNIGRCEQVSLNRLVQITNSLAGKDIRPTYGNPRQGDIRHSLSDITHARGFGYNPQYGLEEGIKAIIDAEYA